MSMIDVCPIEKNKVTLGQVAELFKKLHNYQKNLGYQVPLVEGGEYIWVESLEKTLGRYSQIIIAHDENRVVGFCSGVLRIMPRYYGSTSVGFCDALYLDSAYRNLGISVQMMEQLIRWFREMGARVVEVERICVNEKPAKTFARLGFMEMVIRYKRDIHDANDV